MQAVHVYTDAAGGLGAGGVLGSRWLLSWGRRVHRHQQRRHRYFWKEMFTTWVFGPSQTHSSKLSLSTIVPKLHLDQRPVKVEQKKKKKKKKTIKKKYIHKNKNILI